MPQNTRKRRIRTQHAGVKIKKRSLPGGGTGYRAVFTDPDTEREVYVTLDAKALPSAEARRAWAMAKAKAIARRKMELESGAPRAVGMPLTDALDQYFTAHPQLRERTVAIYRTAATKLLQWAATAGVATTDDLTRPKLIAFREQLVSAKKHAPGRAAKRGEFRPTTRTRSPASVNQDLRATRTVLGYLHDRDLLTKLTGDDLRRALKVVKTPREAPEFLSAAECQALVKAARDHDAAVYAETREEHAGERAVGTTPRYEPIAPFLITVLLTGMRAGEALALRWRDVDLEAKNADDQPVGEIRLRASATKTAHARTISLDVSPMVRDVLLELRAKAGGATYVFGGERPMTRSLAESTRKRLIAEFGAPKFSWQILRSTCATVQCNAPSIFGSAAAFLSAKRLGHSVAVSEKRYAGQLAVSKGARTIEGALGLERRAG